MPNESAQIANFLKTSLIARGVTFYENCALNESAVKVNSNSVTIQVNKDKTIEVEKVLVSIGRKPNTDDIGLNNTKIKTDDNGNILVNDFYKPKISIFISAGDCIGKLQLAHVSSKEAILVLNTCLMAMDYL